MSAEDLIIIGVSGGMDSVFLLDQLYQLKQPLIAAVFDHGLRPEAAEESKFVHAFCAERGIPCVQGAGDVNAYANETGTGTEEAARALRYRFLFDLAAERKAAAVATAHHANDQAETVLMHLLRGSGTDGLCGMQPYSLPNPFSRTIALIRPLLRIPREEIACTVREEGLPYRDDRSNSDPSYTRNRIRLDLIPKLEQEYNPQLVSALCRLAESTALDREVLESACDVAAARISLHFPEAGAEWDRAAFLSEAPGMRMRLLRRVIGQVVPNDPDIGYLNLKEADDFFSQARLNQTVPFPGGIWLRCESGRASILKYLNKDTERFPQLSGGWVLNTRTQHITGTELPEWIAQAKAHPETAIIDAECLGSVPFLRTARPGERFQPGGNGGKSVKLSDFFINSKIPKEYRPGLAVAADEAGILWIPGLRVSQRVILTEHTRTIMILDLTREQRK